MTELTVEVGNDTFALRHEKGETDDHTVTWHADKRVLCCGDLFIWASPNAGNPQKVQRYPREWAQALRRMIKLEPEYLLPGHGFPVMGAARVREGLTDTADLLDSLVDQTLVVMNSGARLDEAIHSVHPPPELAAKPYLRPVYDEPEFVVRTVWRLYGGWWDGNPATLKPARERALAQELADLSGGPSVLADRALALLAEWEATGARTTERATTGSNTPMVPFAWPGIWSSWPGRLTRTTRASNALAGRSLRLGLKTPRRPCQKGSFAGPPVSPTLRPSQATERPRQEAIATGAARPTEWCRIWGGVSAPSGRRRPSRAIFDGSVARRWSEPSGPSADRSKSQVKQFTKLYAGTSNYLSRFASVTHVESPPTGTAPQDARSRRLPRLRSRRWALGLAILTPLVLTGCKVPSFGAYPGATTQARIGLSPVAGILHRRTGRWGLRPPPHSVGGLPLSPQAPTPFRSRRSTTRSWRSSIPSCRSSSCWRCSSSPSTPRTSSMLRPPTPTTVINVKAFQWGWEFDYPGGTKVIGATTEAPVMEIPVGVPVKITLASLDVIHGFYIPEFNFSRYAQPGYVNTFTFNVIHTGTFRGQCTQLCGLYHSLMFFYVHAVTPAQYQAWLAVNAGHTITDGAGPSVATGEERRWLLND